MDKPSKKEVRDQYLTFNADFFGGVLHPRMPVHWVASKKFWADCSEPGEDWPLGRIRLSSLSLPECGWRGVLLHEMIHAALDLTGVEDDLAGRPTRDEWEHGPIPYHGPRFVDEANRIGKLLGMPEVTVEDAWCWPHVFHFPYVPEPLEDE